jgi:hypothetical protein
MKVGEIWQNKKTGSKIAIINIEEYNSEFDAIRDLAETLDDYSEYIGRELEEEEIDKIADEIMAKSRKIENIYFVSFIYIDDNEDVVDVMDNLTEEKYDEKIDTELMDLDAWVCYDSEEYEFFCIKSNKFVAKFTNTGKSLNDVVSKDEKFKVLFSD